MAQGFVFTAKTMYLVLSNSSPYGREVYRIIKISGDRTLKDLCGIILDAFNFYDDHMYEFCMDNRMYSQYSYQPHPEAGQASVRIKLDQLNLMKGQKFSLHYDFGDDWMFAISVQKVAETSEKKILRVVRGKGSAEQYPDWDEE